MCHTYNQETTVMFWKVCLLFSLQAIFFKKKKGEFHPSQIED